MVTLTTPLLQTIPQHCITYVQVENAGLGFLSHYTKRMRFKSFSTIDDYELNGGGVEHPNKTDESSSSSDEGEDIDSSYSDYQIDDAEIEDDIMYLRTLDPKQCKDQDHYKVLGLQKVRWRASEALIRKAHRSMVLKHHPDKRKAQQGGIEIREDDDYFTCITKAAEILSSKNLRRSYDSVDPAFDNSIPSESEVLEDGSNFYSIFTPVFERNERWSTVRRRQNILKLGDDSYTRDNVDRFYKFWYGFQSWREYSYLDEEDKDKGSDRYERRWIEKNNRVQRAEKKREEMARIRKFVDLAYKLDPRVQKFVEADKQEREARRFAKQEAIRIRREEDERILREITEKEAKLEADRQMAEKERQESVKRERDARKQALKKGRKTLRTLCEENNYFASEEDKKIENMTDLEKLLTVLESDQLTSLSQLLVDKLKIGESEDAQNEFEKALGRVNQRLKEESHATANPTMNSVISSPALDVSRNKSSTVSSTSSQQSTAQEWSTSELNLLIKSVNMFPAGTSKRWEVVASFVNQHKTENCEVIRSPKECLSKAKHLQSGGFQSSSLKEDVNKNAYANLEKLKKRDVKVESGPSQRTDSAADIQGVNLNPWSPDEQRLLEQALKTYPTSTVERWDRISECLVDRSKKDCMRRYKELAEIVRSKRAAQAAVTKGS